MKILILTTLYQWDSAYSLSSVMESQMVSLIKRGYEVVLAVHDNFTDDNKVPEGVEIRKTIPRFLLIDYKDFQEPLADLENQAQEAYEAIKETIKDIDIVIEHDFLLQGWFMPYCMAIHRLAKESTVKWLHWIHSIPIRPEGDIKYPHNLRFSLPENSKLVFLNNTHLVRAAEAYGLMPKDVRIVHNPVDPRLFWNFDPLVNTMIDKFGLLNKDLVQVYPLSTTRMVHGGKQLEIAIEIFAHLKKLGRSVALVVCNAHANDKREKQVIGETLSFAQQRGLNQTDLIFTSLEDPKYELGVSREVISQLFHISNLFIFPSIVENCPLILLEAMLSKCLLILNKDVHSMREFGQENALYFQFGGIDRDGDIIYKDRNLFMEQVARFIISEFENNKALKASNRIKQHFNYDRVFEQQLMPLLHEK